MDLKGHGGGNDAADGGSDSMILREILPKTGLVYSERGALSEILCKPKIMPLKSAVLEKIQKIEGEAEDQLEVAHAAQNFVQVSR